MRLKTLSAVALAVLAVLSFPDTLAAQGNTLSVLPEGDLTFFHRPGSLVPPPAQALQVLGTSTLAISVETITDPAPPQGQPSWLIADPGTAATPRTVFVRVNPTGLPLGVYSGLVRITASGASNSPITVPVTFIIADGPRLTSNPSFLTLRYQTGQILPPPANLTISTSTGVSVQFSATASTSNCGTGWLNISNNIGITPAAIAVTVSVSGLTPGVCVGQVRVSSAAGTIQIPVILVVSASPLLNIQPTSLLFNAGVGGANPGQQSVNLSSTAPAAQGIPYEISASTTNGGNWLQVTVLGAGVTPSVAAVGVNAVGLQIGVYFGRIDITAPLQVPTSIPVVLVVGASSTITASPSSFSFTQIRNSVPPPARISNLTVTGPASTFSATATTITGGNWLQVSPPSGSFPGSLTITADGSGLALGTYTGQVIVAAPGAAGISIGVTMTVTDAGLIANPTTLAFTQDRGATPPPAQQTNIQLNTGGGLGGGTFSALATTAAGGNWLSVTPPSGGLPNTLTISVDGRNLAVGIYEGQVVVTSPNAAAVTIPVRMTVREPVAPVIQVSPASLTFNFTPGGAAPAPQVITITSSTPAVVNVSTFTTLGGQWLQATPASGNTPLTASVSLNTAGLTPGIFNGFVSVSSALLASPINIPVSVNVSAPIGPSVNSATNGASFQPGPISVGVIFTVKGTNLGPATGTVFTLNQQGGIDASLAGVRVLFDGFPGTPLFVREDQINVVVPYEIAGRNVTRMVVEYNGRTSTPLDLAVATTSPGIFTAGSTGLGQGAIVNQNGSLNGAPGQFTIPAAPGSFISIYMTGGGQSAPPSTTGSVTSGLRLIPNVTVNIAGRILTPEFAGYAPSYTTGLVQINVRLPEDVGRGLALPLSVNIGGVNSQPGVTIAIQ